MSCKILYMNKYANKCPKIVIISRIIDSGMWVLHGSSFIFIYISVGCCSLNYLGIRCFNFFNQF